MADVLGVNALKRRLNALKKSPTPILAIIQTDTVAFAKRNLTSDGHVKTGFTRRSVRRGTLTKSYAIVLAGGASVFIEKGTKPHRIPKSGNAKRPMPIGGSRRLSGSLRRGSSPAFFAWHVQHPGTKADPFLVPAAKEALAKSGWDNVPAKLWNGAA